MGCAQVWICDGLVARRGDDVLPQVAAGDLEDLRRAVLDQLLLCSTQCREGLSSCGWRPGVAGCVWPPRVEGDDALQRLPARQDAGVKLRRRTATLVMVAATLALCGDPHGDNQRYGCIAVGRTPYRALYARAARSAVLTTPPENNRIPDSESDVPDAGPTVNTEVLLLGDSVVTPPPGVVLGEVKDWASAGTSETALGS
jgi:hypothetical protein